MYYKYRLKDDRIMVIWRSPYQYMSTVTYYQVNKMPVELLILKDNIGEYVLFNEEKVYLNNYIAFTIEEFNDAIKRDDRNYYIFSSDLCQTILKAGVDNVCIDLYTDGDGLVRYNIVEDYNRELVRDYKIKLVPEDTIAHRNTYTFYTNDFMQYLMNGSATLCRKLKAA